MAKSFPCRSCEVVTYVSHLHIKRVLERWGNEYIKEWAYCHHDRDRWLDTDLEDYKKAHNGESPSWNVGDLKEPHTHILLVFWKEVRSSTVLTWFLDPWNHQNSRIEKIKTTLADAYAYLDHRNNPDKFQYPAQSIYCSNRDYWETLDDYNGSDDPLRSALLERLEGVPYRDLVMRYGRDFIVHSKSVDHCVQSICREESSYPDILTLENTINEMESQVLKLQAEKTRLQNELNALNIERKSYERI